MTFRHATAALLLGGVLAWLLFGDYKGIALGAAIPVVLLCRVLVIPSEEDPSRRCFDDEIDSDSE